MSIQSSKESSNCNNIVCFAGVVDTGKVEYLRESSKKIDIVSTVDLPTGTRRSCLKKKTRGEKSRGTVPVSHPGRGGCADPVNEDAILERVGGRPPGRNRERQLASDTGDGKT